MTSRWGGDGGETFLVLLCPACEDAVIKLIGQPIKKNFALQHLGRHLWPRLMYLNYVTFSVTLEPTHWLKLRFSAFFSTFSPFSGVLQTDLRFIFFFPNTWLWRRTRDIVWKRAAVTCRHKNCTDANGTDASSWEIWMQASWREGWCCSFAYTAHIETTQCQLKSAVFLF